MFDSPRSEGQRNRNDEKAQALLKWTVENLGSRDFSLAQVLDAHPLDNPVTAEKMAACKAEIVRRNRIFGQLEQQDMVIRSERAGEYVLTEKGTKQALREAERYLNLLLNASDYSSKRVRWETLGGRPFAEDRADDQLTKDMLVRIWATTHNVYPGFEKGWIDGSHGLEELTAREKTRRSQLNERSRLTAAFNTLTRQGYIESPAEDDIYCLTPAGVQHLEELD